MDNDVYSKNVEFWKRAWSPVKTPYTQMPDLPYIDQISQRLKAENAHHVLDLGCGSGWLSIYLARQGFQVTGVDIAPQAIALAEAWAARENLANARFLTGDIIALDLQMGGMDAVVANSIFEHLTLSLASASLRKIRQTLKPDGMLFGCFDKVGGGPGEYYELDDGTHVYTDKARRGMLLRCFSDEELKDLFAGWYIDSFDVIESGSRLVWARSPGVEPE